MLAPAGHKAGLCGLEEPCSVWQNARQGSSRYPPSAVHADVKDKYCGTYFKCMRQMGVDKPFSFPRLVCLFAASFGHTSFLCSFAPSLSQCRFLRWGSLFVW